MMWETLGTVRDLGRLQDIASVLIRWGFGDVVKRIEYERGDPREGAIDSDGDGRLDTARTYAPNGEIVRSVPLR